MGEAEQEFRLQIDRVIAGDQDAATALLERYGPALLQAVRRRLSKRLRTKFDSLDFVQDVWASFFANPPAGHLFDGPDQLVAFLTQVARNKVVDATRQRLVGQKFSVNREQSLDNSTIGGPGEVQGNQSTPSEIVGRREQWDQLLQEQPLVYRGILVLWREGKARSEIAAELGIHPRTVQRVIEKVLPRLMP
jgi:RNA polymerase sigma-70 factor (ECF subfamily)